LFTLFDPRGVEQRVSDVLGPQPSFASTWKTKLFEYSWLRASAGRYRDFEGLVQDALRYAERAHGLSLSAAQRVELASAFTALSVWPDTTSTLETLRARGLKLTPLANFSPRMIARLLEQAGLTQHFDLQLSTDRAKTYKPDPRAYALAEAALSLPRERIAFAAFGGWDAAGARWFGFPTFWVDRLAQPEEELAVADARGPDLVSLARWIVA
jgi:2-haloacid dehalogenase